VEANEDDYLAAASVFKKSAPKNPSPFDDDSTMSAFQKMHQQTAPSSTVYVPPPSNFVSTQPTPGLGPSPFDDDFDDTPKPAAKQAERPGSAKSSRPVSTVSDGDSIYNVADPYDENDTQPKGLSRAGSMKSTVSEDDDGDDPEKKEKKEKKEKERREKKEKKEAEAKKSMRAAKAQSKAMVCAFLDSRLAFCFSIFFCGYRDPGH